MEGRNCFLKVDDEARLTGFYTTRVVRAATSAEAREQAIVSVRDELEKIVLPEHLRATDIEVTEIDELPEEFRQPKDIKGFSWYLQEDEH